MRRALLAVVVTVLGLVLLLSFKPHEVSPAALRPAATSGTDQAVDAQRAQGSVTGASVDTRWGPVQVAITVSGGRISAVDVIQAPDGNHRDIEINQRALPILIQETLDAQSAQIDMVSGATYTSEGYLGSLQSAIDQAGL
ncbi:FMN-binding protein [Acrocarpospora catenulata]|uniref:FMN-binding protein n=1 Tax=Acrocarpospora catenulata TaxID=2836182 RepID=UPI001BDAE042|nr:FMN-binding protein [Acrocarpospora catenulata]